MRLEPESPRRTDEERRYFPDWTRSLADAREEIEADHNSYLAGGYAEEFGYLAEADSSRGVPVLEGESADDCAVRLVQWGATHPGYPLRPYPIDPAQAAADAATSITSSVVSYEGRYETGHRGKFVSVTDRPFERQHHQLLNRVAAAATRFLAALVGLRWDFRSFR